MSTAAAKVDIGTPPGGLTQALIAAQQEFLPAYKDAENPHFRSKFCDLAGAHEATKGPLWKHGLTVVQKTKIHFEGGAPLTILITKLRHVSGEFEEGEYPLLPAKQNDPQALGACLTYARRYCYMAILGIAPEDDDGEEASGRKPAPKAQEHAKPAAAQTPGPSAASAPPSERKGMITDKQRGFLRGLIEELLPPLENEAEAATKGRWLEWLRWAVGRDVKSTEDLTMTEARKAIDAAKAGDVPA